MSGIRSTDEDARLADELQKNPLWRDILGELEGAAIDVWRRSTSPQQREEQWHLVVSIAALGTKIASRLEAKKLAAASSRKKATHGT
jgi:hypothetical protein